jgi:AcrR family transcriptional regulator
MASESSEITRTRIIDAAEKLFATSGFSAASLRAITSAAKVNLAAVNYHFGSKDALIKEVFARHLKPLNSERLKLLTALEQQDTAPPSVEKIMEAFIAPVLHMRSSDNRTVILRLLGQAMNQANTNVRRLFTGQFQQVFERFLTALHRALPQLSKQDLSWRFFFSVGSMAHTMALADDIKRITKGTCDPSDTEAMIQQMVRFVATGLAAPGLKGMGRRKS